MTFTFFINIETWQEILRNKNTGRGGGGGNGLFCKTDVNILGEKFLC